MRGLAGIALLFAVAGLLLALAGCTLPLGHDRCVTVGMRAASGGGAGATLTPTDCPDAP